MHEIVFVGLGLNNEMKIGLRDLEVKPVDSSLSHGRTATFKPADDIFIYVGNAMDLDASSFTLEYNGLASVANRIISCNWNSTRAFTGSFSCEKASFTPTNTGDVTVTPIVSAPDADVPLASPYHDILLLIDTHVAYWSQGMYDPPTGFNHGSKIDHNDIIALVNSYVTCWNG